MDDLRSWGLDSLCSFCSVSVQRRPRKTFPLSTFHRLSSLIHRNPAPFTTPSVVMIRMLPVLVWCPGYRPTYSFGCIPLATALATAGRQLTGSPKFCNDLLPSTSRASHFSRQAISFNPEETDPTCCHRRCPLQEDEMGLNDLSHMPPHAWQTQQHHSWRAVQLGFHARPTPQMGMPKSQS